MSISRGGIDELLRQRQASDPEVVEAMVQIYRAPVYRLALSILENSDDAEDAVQDAFIRATAHLERYQVGTNFKAWLFTITINTCRGYLRKRALQQRLQQVLGPLQALTGHPSKPEARLEQNEAQEKLWDVVAQLPEKQRLVILLRQGHDLSIDQIAQILETNPKTVYSRLYDGYRNLRSRLKRSGDYGWLEEEWKA